MRWRRLNICIYIYILCVGVYHIYICIRASMCVFDGFYHPFDMPKKLTNEPTNPQHQPTKPTPNTNRPGDAPPERGERRAGQRPDVCQVHRGARVCVCELLRPLVHLVPGTYVEFLISMSVYVCVLGVDFVVGGWFGVVRFRTGWGIWGTDGRMYARGSSPFPHVSSPTHPPDHPNNK